MIQKHSFHDFTPRVKTTLLQSSSMLGTVISASAKVTARGVWFYWQVDHVNDVETIDRLMKLK